VVEMVHKKGKIEKQYFRKKSLEAPSYNFVEGRASLSKEGSVGERF